MNLKIRDFDFIGFPIIFTTKWLITKIKLTNVIGHNFGYTEYKFYIYERILNNIQIFNVLLVKTYRNFLRYHLYQDIFYVIINNRIKDDSDLLCISNLKDYYFFTSGLTEKKNINELFCTVNIYDLYILKLDNPKNEFKILENKFLDTKYTNFIFNNDLVSDNLIIYKLKSDYTEFFGNILSKIIDKRSSIFKLYIDETYLVSINKDYNTDILNIIIFDLKTKYLINRIINLEYNFSTTDVRYFDGKVYFTMYKCIIAANIEKVLIHNIKENCNIIKKYKSEMKECRHRIYNVNLPFDIVHTEYGNGKDYLYNFVNDETYFTNLQIEDVFLNQNELNFSVIQNYNSDFQKYNLIQMSETDSNTLLKV